MKEIKSTKDLVQAIDKEIRLCFDSKTEVAKKAGFTKQHLNTILNKIEKEDNQISFNNILKLINSLGLKIVLMND